jgi:hypothetical protein
MAEGWTSNRMPKKYILYIFSLRESKRQQPEGASQSTMSLRLFTPLLNTGSLGYFQTRPQRFSASLLPLNAPQSHTRLLSSAAVPTVREPAYT